MIYLGNFYLNEREREHGRINPPIQSFTDPGKNYSDI